MSVRQEDFVFFPWEIVNLMSQKITHHLGEAAPGQRLDIESGQSVLHIYEFLVSALCCHGCYHW